MDCNLVEEGVHLFLILNLSFTGYGQRVFKQVFQTECPHAVV